MDSEVEVANLTEDEKKIVEAKRQYDASVRACTEEINSVLNKYGLVMTVNANPQIGFSPKAE